MTIKLHPTTHTCSEKQDCGGTVLRAFGITPKKISRLTPRELQEILTENGFSVTTVYHTERGGITFKKALNKYGNFNLYMVSHDWRTPYAHSVAWIDRMLVDTAFTTLGRKAKIISIVSK